MTTAVLALLVAFVPEPPPPDPAGLLVHDPDTLTDSEARKLQGRRLLYWVVLDGEVEAGRCDCAGDDGTYRSVWFDPGQAAAAERATQGSGLLVVEATLRRVRHPLLRGPTGRACRPCWSTGWCGPAWSTAGTDGG
jgi:hypothetical protein